MRDKKKIIYFIIGVSGSGKSTIGELLARELSIPFFDGDDYHPEANVRKMVAGHPLTDEDRRVWLVQLNQLARENIIEGAVITCSALKELYRTILANGIEENVSWIFLEGSFIEILERLQVRKNHFMPIALLQSQFDTLEIPQDAMTISISKTPDEIVRLIQNCLGNN